MFIGVALGTAVSGLPGLGPAPAIGTGIGAMCGAMLRLPLASTLPATLLLGGDGVVGNRSSSPWPPPSPSPVSCAFPAPGSPLRFTRNLPVLPP
jgi:hypothetical protein